MTANMFHAFNPHTLSYID